MYQVVEVSVLDYEGLLRMDLREFDQREANMLGGVETILKDCFTTSRVFAGKVDEAVACIFGVVPGERPADPAVLWLVTSPLVAKHRISFVKLSTAWLAWMLKEYGYLQAFVLEENVPSQTWLRRLGFEQKGFGPAPEVGTVYVFERTL